MSKNIDNDLININDIKNTAGVNIVNRYSPVMYLETDGNLYKINTDESVTLEVNPEKFTLTVDGEIDYSEFDDVDYSDSTLKEKFFSKLAVTLLKKTIDKVLETALFAKCSYEFSSIKDNAEIIFELEDFSLGCKCGIMTDFMIAYPKAITSSADINLVGAAAKNKDAVLKTLKKEIISESLTIDILWGFITLPFKMMYFKHLCKDRIVMKNIMNADTFINKDIKRKKRKSHPFLFLILVILVIIILEAFISPLIFPENLFI